MRLHLRRVLSGAALMLCGLYLLLTLTSPWNTDLETSSWQDLLRKQEEELYLEDSKYQHFTVKVNEALHTPHLKQHGIVAIQPRIPNPKAAGVISSSDSIAFPQYAHGRDTPLRLWPDPRRPLEDRILQQMRFVPPGVKGKDPEVESNIKTIYLPGGIGSDTPKGRKKFKDEQCPVDLCWITDNPKWQSNADVVLYQNEYYYSKPTLKPREQIWVLWLLESPFHTGPLDNLNGALNWTATYRSDSTIVTPYEKFVHFSNYTGLPRKATKNYAEGKTKLVAWFVSNCSARNKRWEYVQALRMHGVDVHVYGACGEHQCDRFVDGLCDEMLSRDYKFYLSFENSNCQGYITEKFFQNGLKNDIVPVVMGGRREDYEAVAPPSSYIFAEDFANPALLAARLLELHADDAAYNGFFRWKGTGEFINTKFWCRLCAMLHGVDGDGGTAGSAQQWYADAEGWWRANDTCTYNRWDEPLNYVDDWDVALNQMENIVM